MRFIVLGREVDVEGELVRKIVTTELSNRFYWMHNNMLTREKVFEFLEHRAGFDLVKKCCYYILFYAENLVLTTYLVQLASGEEDMYLNSMLPVLERLRELYGSLNEVNAYDVADEMINVCLNVAIDPF